MLKYTHSQLMIVSIFYRVHIMNKLRYKHFWIDFQGDGMFSKERIKGKDKRILRKWTIREQYKQFLKSRKNEDTYYESKTSY